MHEVRLPKMGQSVEEAPIVEWFKQEGDRVEAGEPLFSIQTDKAEVECEAPASGVLRKILLQPDIEVPVLSVVALIGDPEESMPDLGQYTIGGGDAPAPPATAPASPATAPAPPAAAPAAGSAPVSPRARKRAAAQGVEASRLAGSGVGGRVMAIDVEAAAGGGAALKASPTAKRLAEAEGVNLASITGTGPGGKIVKDDVIAAKEAPAAPAPTPAPAAPGGVRRVPLTPMRKIIAQRMSESKYNAPHYYVTIEADMTAAKRHRAGLPYKVSYNDLVLASVVRGLREFPSVNARWAGDAIEEVADVNLGVAVALPQGLVVPVIQQAQTLSLEGLSRAAKDLIDKAKSNKLLPDDYQGNTFTVSNMGVFGVDDFTAIINQPDSAILAVGAMKEKVVAIDGGVYIRPMMRMTLSSDHRVIDGAVAAQFMGRLKELMEQGAF
ncbi:MAG: dihydrolipoamide acetyltransferase family protein [Candidatus Hydrogenedentota bacterium]